MSRAGLFLTHAGQGGQGTDLKSLLLTGILARLFPQGPSESSVKNPDFPQLVLSAGSLIQTHQLLRETDAHGPDTAHPSLHRSIDQWVDRVSNALGGPPRWAALCLMGLTCKEVGAGRFLALYPSLAGKLITMWKEGEGQEVKLAVLAALSDLVGRLGQLADVPGVRREGAAIVAKVVQPLIGAISSAASLDQATEALNLLAVCLQSFPSPFRHHSEDVETAVIGLLLKSPVEGSLQEIDSSLSLTPNLRRAAMGLALLPTAAGDAATWSALICRVLIALNYLLTPAFAGLESPTAFEAAATFLQPAGGIPPHPLGRFNWSLSDAPTNQLWPPTIALLTSLMTTVQLMLTSTYPAPVPIPTAPVLALITRVLRVDGALSSAGAAYDSLARDRQAAVAAQIRNLQTLAFDLVGALLASGGTHLAPHGGVVTGFVGDALRQTAGEGGRVSGFRVRVYRAAEEILVCLGAGVSLLLAPSLVSHAISDLRLAHRHLTQPRTPDASALHLSEILQPQGGGSTGGRRGGGGKRRKETGERSIGGAVLAGPEVAEALEVAGGALRAVERLLAVGGPFIPEKWRSELDAAVFQIAHLATGASDRAVPGALRLAACGALLASVTSPRGHRPPYLPQALTLFKRCRLESGSEIGDFSSRAVLVLEALLHPRSLPVLTRPRSSAGKSSLGGEASAADGPPRNAYGTDPWQEAEAWLGYGAGFRHGLEAVEGTQLEEGGKSVGAGGDDLGGNGFADWGKGLDRNENRLEAGHENVETRAGRGMLGEEPTAGVKSEGFQEVRQTGVSDTQWEASRRANAARAQDPADVIMTDGVVPGADVAVRGADVTLRGDDVVVSVADVAGSGVAEARPSITLPGIKLERPVVLEASLSGMPRELEGRESSANEPVVGNGRLGQKRSREEEVLVGQSVTAVTIKSGINEITEVAASTSVLEASVAPKVSAEARAGPGQAPKSKSEKEREAALASEVARNVFGLPPRVGGDDSDSDGSLPSIVDGDPDDDDYM